MAIINLISGPRNISTALMYSFAQRKNSVVLDEPYYAYYLFDTGLVHPGRDEILASQPTEKEEVTRNIFNLPASTYGDVFIKNMSKHLEVVGNFPFEKCMNVFLIRNPRQIISSFAQVIETPTMHDIGIEYQYQLFEQLKEGSVVMDAGLVLENPEVILKKLCAKLNIEYESSMLHWPAGPKPFDGVWAPHWYSNVHRSTGFARQSTSERLLPEHLTLLAERADVFYKKLLPFAIQP